jgi:hypothetical protein
MIVMTNKALWHCSVVDIPTVIHLFVIRKGVHMIRLNSRGIVCLCLTLIIALSAAFNVGTVRADDPGPDPATVIATVAPGSSLTVTKTIHTPEIPPKPDIVFLADTTGSMGDALSNVSTNANAVLTAVRNVQADSQFGVAEYRDFNCTDPFAYRLNQAVTTSLTDAQTAISAWATGNGCDTPEAQLNALYQLATDPATGWRADSTRIIAWFGDSNGHDPSGGHTLADAIAALQAASIRVIAVPVVTDSGNGLDTGGQATAITTATSGVLLPGATSDQVADAILSGLTNLPVTVSWSLGTCDPSLTVNLTPASQTVTSGTDAVFTETIDVALDAPQGTTVSCEVNFLLDGEAVEGFTQSIQITVPDVTPPTAFCEPTTNPSGKNVPPASGQNPDGFYVLSTTDNVDPNPQIFVADSMSSYVFGPYASGTEIKLVQAPGVTPSAVPGTGVIDWKIKLKGDAIVTATDAAGNVSDPVFCRVPPPPK